MLWKIGIIGNHRTVHFAAEEIGRYLRLMDEQTEIAMLHTDVVCEDFSAVLWVGQDPSFDSNLPQHNCPALDDSIYIDVQGTSGVVTGGNPRSVLLAAYRFLTELGCAWVRPGPDGEIIPQKRLGQDSIQIRECPSYRHRGICIEGAVSYRHVYDMIDWLPKVGMNGYFNQFMVPFIFFNRWYSHMSNPELDANPMSAAEISAIARAHIQEIKKRDMLYHSVGHGWTCESFGIEGNSWEVKEYHIPEGVEENFALINGQRKLWDGVPLNTNLCYSKDAVRDRMVSAAAEYCERNKEVDYLHFWLADGANNHCECDNCRDTLPSDFYVHMLNELDAKLTSMGLDTKIVFLIYVDLLWEPETARLQNPDRFVLMFAPISRTYTNSYAEADVSASSKPAAYVRNRLTMPRDVSENLARLRKWQELFDGDSFLFDYHFMWDHYHDPGYTETARVLFEDIKSLGQLRLNGLVSCQVQRAFFPTGLGMCLMARALWNKDASFSHEANRYYQSAFGADWQLARDYLSSLTALFDPVYLRKEKVREDTDATARYEKIPALIEAFGTTIDANLKCRPISDTIRKSWNYLRLHAQLCLILAKALRSKTKGDQASVRLLWQDMAAWARFHEMELAHVFDVHEFIPVMKNALIEDT